MNDVQLRLYYETKCKNCLFYEETKYNITYCTVGTDNPGNTKTHWMLTKKRNSAFLLEWLPIMIKYCKFKEKEIICSTKST